MLRDWRNKLIWYCQNKNSSIYKSEFILTFLRLKFPTRYFPLIFHPAGIFIN